MFLPRGSRKRRRRSGVRLSFFTRGPACVCRARFVSDRLTPPDSVCFSTVGRKRANEHAISVSINRKSQLVKATRASRTMKVTVYLRSYARTCKVELTRCNKSAQPPIQMMRIDFCDISRYLIYDFVKKKKNNNISRFSLS